MLQKLPGCALEAARDLHKVMANLLYIKTVSPCFQL